MRNFCLKGKTALITGAAGLLGVEHAVALLETGATVVVTDVNVEKLNDIYLKLTHDFGVQKVIQYSMNVTQPLEIRTVAQELSRNKIRVDILINNAAIDPKVTSDNAVLESSRLENFTLEQWNSEISVGLTGAVFCSQVFGTAMASDGSGGVILNIASDLSVFSPDQRLYRKEGLSDSMQPVKPVTYSVIKAGLVGLTRYLSTYWADKAVRCNSLSPGGVYTGQPDEFVHKLSSLIPLGRMAYRDEYRSAVQFLCSNASSYMSGQNIIIDGGRSVW